MLPSTFYYIEFAIKLGKMVLMGLDRKREGGRGIERERDGKRLGGVLIYTIAAAFLLKTAENIILECFLFVCFHNDSVNKLLSWVFENT